MISLFLLREEFAARRRKAQDVAVEALSDPVSVALTDQRLNDELTDAIKSLFALTYQQESGEDYTGTVPESVFNAVQALLDKSNPDSDLRTTSLAIANFVLNAATERATQDDPDELALEWVTMHDGEVRVEHKDVDGEQRLVGEKFEVAGVKMSGPGDITAPIELWINCRCSLRPTLISEEFRSTEGTAMTAAATEEKVDPEVAPEEEPTTEADQEFVTDLVPWHGVLAPEGVMSGDGRMFAPDSLTNRDLPLPLTYQRASDDGHKGSVTVASIETIERIDGLMHASGFFLATPEADEVVGLVSHFGKFGVSIDADDAELEYNEEDGSVTFSKARIASASVVSIPAFAEAYISLGPWDQESLAAAAAFKDLAPGKTEDGPGWLTHPVDTDRLRDYWVRGPGAAKIGWGTPGDFNRCRVNLAEYIKPQYLSGYCANRHYDALGIWPGEHNSVVAPPEGDPAPAVSLVADATIKAPSDWFKNPEFTELTHLQVTEEGRVFGHVAQWGVCHIGINGICTVAPENTNGYARYANKSVLLEDGSFARTGVLTLGGKHAPGHLSAAAATVHYDTTSAALADVSIGEDEHGIWVAGWVRPGTPQENIVALRGSDLSGDWRKVGGELDLVAVLAVNTGGFPIKVATHHGEMVSLVAAGMVQQEESTSSTIDYGRMAEALANEIEGRQKRRERMAALAAKVKGQD